ncbi:MAG: aminotransferase class V-fold PLP-dependent enzyme, partial [Candidatus Cloacimonetes bacterium]|nr:aminotransferase class V-fold PLP-dependent enzyme [Candidatus Cloacimonadota bacterium]
MLNRIKNKLLRQLRISEVSINIDKSNKIGHPVFVDVEPRSYSIDIEKIENAINEKTKAIMPVHIYGQCTDMDSILAIARKYNLKVIEDSAQALGSFYPDNRHMGTVGKVGSFSFSSPKVISTGQGGALVTNDDKFAYKLRRLKDFGRSGGGNDIHDSVGYNFKFTDIQAVIGIEQMKKLKWRIARKKEILAKYINNLKDVHQVKFFNQDLKHTTPWFIDVFAENRDRLSS